MCKREEGKVRRWSKEEEKEEEEGEEEVREEAEKIKRKRLLAAAHIWDHVQVST